MGLGQPGVPFASRTPPQAINCRRVATKIDPRTGAVWRRATRSGHPKTMLAKRLPSILPTLSATESIETTRIYSALGRLNPGQPLMVQRPFRSPHHTISDAGLVGGSSPPAPGEVSLANNGVLFLDELPEFNRKTLARFRFVLYSSSFRYPISPVLFAVSAMYLLFGLSFFASSRYLLLRRIRLGVFFFFIPLAVFWTLVAILGVYATGYAMPSLVYNCPLMLRKSAIARRTFAERKATFSPCQPLC